MDVPVLPYPEDDGTYTSGHQGDASKDAEKARRGWQMTALIMVDEEEEHGLTVKEFREAFNIHHGIASSALSVLHKDGMIVKLRERRNRCGVYVRPRYVAGRITVDRKGNRRPVEAVKPEPAPAPQEAPGAPEKAAMGVLEAMLGEIESTHPFRGRLHDDTCWRMHGRCALEEAIRRLET